MMTWYPFLARIANARSAISRRGNKNYKMHLMSLCSISISCDIDTTGEMGKERE